MVRLIKKDRLSNKNESYYIKEGKQVGTLYHVCTLDALVEYIIPKDELSSSEKYWNPLLKTNKQVSFTRDRLFVVPTWTVTDSSILFQFVVDGDKLSDRYKITPFNGNISSDKRTNPKKFEKEEVVIGPITNFKSYIKEVYFDIKNLIFKNTKNIIEYLEKVKEYLGSIKCTRTTLPFIKSDWSLSYKKTKNEFDLYKVKTLDELIGLLKNIKDISVIDYIDTKDLFNKYISDLSENQIDDILKEHPNWLNTSDLDSLINTATRNNNVSLVKLCVKSGADVNSKDKDGETPLYWACSNNHTELIKLLLEHGAEVNSKNKYGITPLSLSCSNNNIDMVKLLLEHGAEVNSKDESDNTPLIWACSKENIELIKLLLEYGAEVNSKNKYGETPLYEACVHKDISLAKLLLKYGADKSINVKCSLGYSPFSWACIYNSLTLVKLLLKYGADTNIIYKEDSFSEKEGTALYHICNTKKGKPNIKLAKLLLENGADPNIKDSYNRTPLYWACDKGNLELSKLFIEHGADVNNGSGHHSPLFRACSISKPNIELVKLLLDHGADFNNRYGDFLYIVRFYGNNIDLIKLLLEHGAGKDLDVNNLPDDITKNKQVEELVTSYLNKNKNESVRLRRLYRRYL